MLGSEYSRYDMLGLAHLIKTKQISEDQLLDATIDKIEEFNPKLNAVNHKFYDRARQQILNGTAAGQLQGVPFLLKDLGSDYANAPITQGSQIFRGHVSRFSSAVVDRYVQAGLVIVGRTTSSEFGLGSYTETKLDGATRNPWAADRSAGGSSGGAAAVVAARVMPAAHASDAGGSIRLPAAWCGVFGLKPSRGRVPNGPARGEGLGFFMHHAISVSVRDNAALLDAITAVDPGAPYQVPLPQRPFLNEVGDNPGRLRIAFVDRADGLAIGDDAQAATKRAAKLCEELGHHVELVKYPVDLANWWKNQQVMSAGDTHFRIASFEQQAGRTVGEADLDRWTWLNYQIGKSISAATLLQAFAEIQAMTRLFANTFANFDVIASPTVCQPPEKLGVFPARADSEAVYRYQRESHPFTSIYNWSGLPAMSVPLFWNADGLPLGTQFGAAWGREDILFRLAGQLESAASWADRRPPISVA